MSPRFDRLLLALCPLALLVSGCSLVLPEVTHQPKVHNPFPQFSRVAVLPFFNQSNEPTVDGREFALAYYAELQGTPGFEVVPVNVAETAQRELNVNLADPEGRRFLANKLGVDALVIGTVTDFSPYYPPRCGMRVDWYAANGGFHEIPAGYGLPWGTPFEEYIPERMVFDAEMALARKQMETQSPEPVALQAELVPSPPIEPSQAEPNPFPMPPAALEPPTSDPFEQADPSPTEPEALPPPPTDVSAVSAATFEAPIDETRVVSPEGVTTAPPGMSGAAFGNFSLPADWPDARGFSPHGPSPVRPQAVLHNGPVMTHTRVFRGSDTEFTAALASYVDFRDDARFGGWESYLDRSEDFIRFCCHLHLSEMLSARGGSGETRVVQRWASGR